MEASDFVLEILPIDRVDWVDTDKMRNIVLILNEVNILIFKDSNEFNFFNP